MTKMKKSAEEMGEKAKETAKDISESAKDAYEKAKKNVTGNQLMFFPPMSKFRHGRTF